MVDNSMNVAELYGLYQYISRRLVDSNYLVYETGVLNLYDRMLNGEANRKDFLIFAIQDMLEYIKENNIEGVKSTLMVKFNRIYEKRWNRFQSKNEVILWK